MDIQALSSLEIATGIADRKWSSREVCQLFAESARNENSRLNAYISLRDTEDLLGAAERADEAIASGQTTGPLAGLPIAIKDILCTTSLPTTCGSKMLEGFQAPYDATCVRKLTASGLIMLGKTNMDEFAMGGSTETSIYGAARNPWNTEYTAGGSSGGAAVAVAAGMAPLSVGTDTGGSVRQPAAFCGVCGLKPTYGRISRYGLISFASSLDQVGVLARHVEDIAALYSLIAGHDELDSTSLNQPVGLDQQSILGALEPSIAGLKVGVVRDQLEHDSIQPSVQQSVQAAEQALRDLGATIVDVRLPRSKYAVPAYYIVAPCEASSNLARYEGVHYGHRSQNYSADSPLESMMIHSRNEGFGTEVKRRIMLGTFALSAGYYDAYYKKALQVRRLISDEYASAFADVDVLLGPVAPTPAFPLGDHLDDPVQMYLGDLFTVGANLAGIPALSIPAGIDEASKLPLAVQLQGPALSENKLLNIAYQLQLAQFFSPQVASTS